MNNYNQQPQMPYRYIGFGDAIQICLRKYATFNGRADRAGIGGGYFSISSSAPFSLRSS